MKRTPITLLVLAAAAAGCTDAPQSPASLLGEGPVDPAAPAMAVGVPLAATVQFGLEFGDVGSPFPPSHDKSFHSYVRVHPRTVVIATGGEVTFEMASRPPHSLGIYDAGKRPNEIDPASVDGDNLIDDDSDDLLFSTGVTTSDMSYVFETPGRYLVICRVPGHFEHANMYGWVIVK